jgi:hypothetical protein
MSSVHIITCARRSRYVNPSNQCVLRRGRQMRRACGAPRAFPSAPHSFLVTVQYITFENSQQPGACCSRVSLSRISCSLWPFLLSLAHTLTRSRLRSHLYLLSLCPSSKTRDLQPRVNLKCQHTHTHTHGSSQSIGLTEKLSTSSDCGPACANDDTHSSATRKELPR